MCDAPHYCSISLTTPVILELRSLPVPPYFVTNRAGKLFSGLTVCQSHHEQPAVNRQWTRKGAKDFATNRAGILFSGLAVCQSHHEQPATCMYRQRTRKGAKDHNVSLNFITKWQHSDNHFTSLPK